MLAPQDLAKKVGQKVLYVGIECYSWGLADYVTAAKNARALGFDSISPKQADGGYRWYSSVAQLAQRRAAVLAQGVGFVPFTYMYGPKFGNGQIAIEVAIAREITETCDGLVVMDLEAEWNGQDGAAALLAHSLSNWPGDIILTTWADPTQQNWINVLKALDPVVSAWNPQEYSNWLDGQEGEFAQAGVNLSKLFPSIDISAISAANNPIAIIADGLKRGHDSFWIWEYGSILSASALTKSILALMPKPAQVTPPPAPTPPVLMTPAPTVTPVKPVVPAVCTPLPAPTHTNVVYGKYTIKSGDALENIAVALNIKNWYQDLFMPNKVVLDAAAAAHGVANSNNGTLIYVGTVLQYPILTGNNN
jgi:hypothetical protein